MSRENLFMPHANNKDADQPAHSHSLIRAYVVHCLDRVKHIVVISKTLAEQYGLSITLSCYF